MDAVRTQWDLLSHSMFLFFIDEQMADKGKGKVVLSCVIMLFLDYCVCISTRHV